MKQPLKRDLIVLLLLVISLVSLPVFSSSMVEAETGIDYDSGRERWARLLWTNITDLQVNDTFPFVYAGSSSNGTLTWGVDQLAGAIMYMQTRNSTYLDKPNGFCEWLASSPFKKDGLHEYDVTSGWVAANSYSASRILGFLAIYANISTQWKPLLQTVTGVYIDRFINETSNRVFQTVAYDGTVTDAEVYCSSQAAAIKALVLVANVLDNGTVRDLAYKMIINYTLGGANLPPNRIRQNGSSLDNYCKEDQNFGLFTTALTTYYNYYPNDTVKARINNITKAFYQYGWNSAAKRWNYRTNVDTGATVSTLGVHGFGITDEAFIHAYLILKNETWLDRAIQDMYTMIHDPGLMVNGLITHSTGPDIEVNDFWNSFARRTFAVFYNLYDENGKFFRNSTHLENANGQFVNVTEAHKRILGWQGIVNASTFADYTLTNRRLQFTFWLQYINPTNARLDTLNELFKAFGIPEFGNSYFIASYPQHDIAVTKVTSSKTVVGQSYSLGISVTVANQGIYPETFNVTVYVNTTLIASLTDITLAIGNHQTLTFTWDTTGFAKGDYTIKATISTVPNENDTSDNILTSVWIFVTIASDVDGDRDVDIYDIVHMCGVYGVSQPDPRYDPNCDIDSDGDIDIFDLVTAAGNYGKSW